MESTSVQTMVCPTCRTAYEGGQFCGKDGAKLEPSSVALQSLVGQILAERYRVVRLLGEGGMGQVYEAEHVHISKRLAIKLLKPAILANPEAVSRFRQEARSASSIGHENIIAVDDFATLPDGSVYLAMEFLEGQSLAERLRSGPPLSFQEAIAIMLQVARGLAAAHEKGIVHRDLKPENIYLAQRADAMHGFVVKILDFGIAKMVGEESGPQTRTGTIFGTPHYMSPEQALGKPVDFRSDIYSYGVIMYQLFSGKVPFEAESFMGILSKHITARPMKPREAAPERHIPVGIEDIILRAMAKEPDERFASMKELEEALAVFADPVVSRRSSQRTAAISDLDYPPPSSRIPYGLLLIVGLVLALIAAGIGWGIYRWRVNAALKSLAIPSAPTKAAKLPIIVIDSEPGGAEILEGEEVVGETPEWLEVLPGTTLEVTLHKDGYRDAQVVLDPSKDRRKVVKLEPMVGKHNLAAHRAHIPGAHVKSTPESPIHAPAAKPFPTRRPSTFPMRGGRPSTSNDPYDRVE